MTNRWLQLSCGDDSAAVAVSGGASGNCNKEEWITPLTTRVRVLGCPSEISKTATPLTANITVVEPGVAFRVPCGQPSSWRVTVVVNNQHNSTIQDVRVTDNFGGEFSVALESVSQGTVSMSTTGASKKVHLSWEVGTLPAHGSAQATLLVSTDRNPAGKQEFTSPGTTYLNYGATLKYCLGGQQQSATSGKIMVTAYEEAPNGGSGKLSSSQLKTVALRAAPLTLQALEKGGPKEPDDPPPTPAVFAENFTPLSQLIELVPAQGGLVAGFRVPQGVRLGWRVSLTVINTLSTEVTDLEVKEHLGAELEVDRATVSVTPASSQVSIVRQGNEKIDWRISQLAPGARANLQFDAYTRMNPGGQQSYSSCTPEDKPNFLNSGATLKYKVGNKKFDLHQPEIPVWVQCEPRLKVEIDATQYFWQIRKPGSFSAEPISIKVLSNKLVSLVASGFADLASLAPEVGYSIPTYYRLSDTKPGTNLVDWTGAADLNGTLAETTPAQLSSWVAWKLWSRLEVSGSTRAAEYEDTAVLTIAVREVCPSVVTERTPLAGARTPLLAFKEVNWASLTELGRP